MRCNADLVQHQLVAMTLCSSAGLPCPHICILVWEVVGDIRAPTLLKHRPPHPPVCALCAPGPCRTLERLGRPHASRSAPTTGDVVDGIPATAAAAALSDPAALQPLADGLAAAQGHCRELWAALRAAEDGAVSEGAQGAQASEEGAGAAAAAAVAPWLEAVAERVQQELGKAEVRGRS